MAGNVKLMTSAGGGVILDTATTTATDVTVQVPVRSCTLYGTGASTITSGTAVTASGTSVNFTDIPSWVKRITVMFNEVSQNSATQTMIVQIGAGSVTTSGYKSSTAYMGVATAAANVTAGFGIAAVGTSDVFSGSLVMTLVGSNVWVASVSGGLSNSAYSYAGGGSLSLGGTLDRVRITTSGGTATFDAGSINILYE